MTKSIADILIIELWIGVCLGLIIDTAIQILLDFCLYRTDKVSKTITLIYFKIAAIVLRKKVVIIKDHARVVLTLAYPSPSGNRDLVGYYNFRYKAFPLILSSDGNVQHLTFDSQTKGMNWLPYDVKERTWMILQGARGFDY